MIGTNAPIALVATVRRNPDSYGTFQTSSRMSRQATNRMEAEKMTTPNPKSAKFQLWPLSHRAAIAD